VSSVISCLLTRTLTWYSWGGELQGWSIIDRLHEITVPTFVINGRLDMAQDPCHVPFFERIPKVKWVTFENSSHSPMWEERERLRTIDHGSRKCAADRGSRFMSLVEAFLQP
jgi:pimeloyl-ACP methyl ester carboxylesterase